LHADGYEIYCTLRFFSTTITFNQGYQVFKKKRRDEVNDRNYWSSYRTEDFPKMASPHGFEEECNTA
jgi:hypothetical protein